MPTLAGHATTLKIGGVSTAFTGEATTTLSATGSGFAALRQITNTVRRILDPNAGITVRDGVTVLAASAYAVDYLFGIIKLNAVPAGAITVDGSYLPTLTVGQGRSCSINMSRAELDAGVFGEAFTKFEPGKKSADGSIERLELFDEDLDPGAGTTTLQALQDAGTATLLEVGLGGGRFFRAWVRLPGLNAESSAEDLVRGTTTWKSVVVQASGRDERVGFGLGA